MASCGLSAIEAAGCLGSWLIVDEGEVVGLCSFKGLPDAAGSAEIGYGIAETRRRNGHATEAVRLLCEEVGRVGGLRALRAETATDNPSSQRVLEHNGFVQVGARHDPEDGDLLLWSKPLGAWAESRQAHRKQTSRTTAEGRFSPLAPRREVAVGERAVSSPNPDIPNGD
uniref:GNAT family N-acetyltransferase n=1 Tax=Phenylobacterium glaciei TaxID=2803784 RepID=A0A974P514_9CAUL|nr:GNAT family N-acetyltransferase [Phenylobacterium glaciei]